MCWIRVEVDAAHEGAAGNDHCPRSANAPDLFHRLNEVGDVLQDIAAEDAVPRVIREGVGKDIKVMYQIGRGVCNDVDPEGAGCFVEPTAEFEAAEDAIPRAVREWVGKDVEVVYQVGGRVGDDVDPERSRRLAEPTAEFEDAGRWRRQPFTSVTHFVITQRPPC